MVMGPEPSTTATDLIDEPAPTLGLAGAPKAVEGRSLGRIAWNRLKRDRVAMGSAGVIVFLVLVAIFAPLIVKLLGHPPNDFHQNLVSENDSLPLAGFGGITRHYLFGVEPVNGRDLFSRVVYGSRISLIIAFFATLLSVGLGVLIGVIAGYFGGWVDTVLSRTMDAILSFPLLLFAFVLAGVIPDHSFGMSGNTLRVVILVFIIGFFSWPYIGRIIRGQTLSIREREYVEAARSLGARPMFIIFREVLPNLVAPILVYTTLLIPTNILFEAALSFLGVGVPPPTATWGGMLSDAVQWATVDPWFMLFPGLAIFITVLAFNLFGDGLRDAFDPRAR
ncbi:MAG TPA: ABC transporter permease [Micromonosporaceae bacterium]|jgi:ABC-type dipeptide/oligopeptide/nickel transport system permease subunit